MNPPRLLLASTSAHRRALLERLGLAFECVAPGVAEAPLDGEAAPARALRLATEKALAVAARHPDALVIGSDQVASRQTTSGTQWLHKPGDRERCRAQLADMSGAEVDFDTGVVLVGPQGRHAHVANTRVRFRPLSAEAIESYIDREPSFDCAGGFKCEGLGVTLFEWMRGDDPTALVGLPLIWLCQALRESGLRV